LIFGMKQVMRYEEKRVLISGGARGIGLAAAQAFAAEGASVHILARSQSVMETAQAIREEGGKSTGHVGSVADETFCRKLIAGIETMDGPVDILVNAAAIFGPGGPFAEIDLAGFGEALQTNLMGTCNLMRWTLPGMTARGFGRIVNFAGGGAAYSYPQFTPYAASKAAIVRLTETIADEIEVPDVTVNVITPGSVATDMQKEVIRRGGEIRTVTSIEEPVQLILYLASADASHITGRFIHVRDDYRNPDLFQAEQMLKLRRIERR
jgi:NAD(P)-dependent dehydrogenase (short-subunit alcohol dehydrogenase family)